MPIYQLSEEIIFPHPEYAEDDGLLAIGGDLSPERLLLAYASGIFPWYNPEDPILWWSPNPRLVVFPEKIKISKSLKQSIRNRNFEIKSDTEFRQVMTLCGNANGRENTTWITDQMLDAYCKLHEYGFAHSIETWKQGKLVGGLYGISIGKAFFGESMFYLERDASKVAFVALCNMLASWGFHVIDAQQSTEHLISLGAEEIERQLFLKILETAVEEETISGSWKDLF